MISLRIVFMGTPEFAIPALMAIVDQGHEVVAVYTRSPAPSGRGLSLRLSPVHAFADRLRLPVFYPSTLRDPEVEETFRSHEADVAVVVAYGMLLPPSFLQAPPLGVLNIHASLLPRWRGAAPIQRAIMNGDRETGVTIMKMTEGLDEGPCALMEKFRILPAMTGGELHQHLARLGADLLIRALGALACGGLVFSPQPLEGVSYARKIKNEEAQINWTLPVMEVHHLIRALSPFPGAFFWLPWQGQMERIKVLKSEVIEDPALLARASILPPGTLLREADKLCVVCGAASANASGQGGGGVLRLLKVQRAGRTAMDVEDFLRGIPVDEGMCLPSL